jgi:hypothetical protein
MATFYADVESETTLDVELRVSSRLGNFSPDRVLARRSFPLRQGANRPILCDFDVTIDAPRYAFVCLMANPAVSVHLSARRVAGIFACVHPKNRVGGSEASASKPEMWTPQRRHAGENLALSLNPPLISTPRNVSNGVAPHRPAQRLAPIEPIRARASPSPGTASRPSAPSS